MQNIYLNLAFPTMSMKDCALINSPQYDVHAMAKDKSLTLDINRCLYSVICTWFDPMTLVREYNHKSPIHI